MHKDMLQFQQVFYMRPIYFKLKNGETVKIRRINANGYGDFMHFLKKFTTGSGEKWTDQYINWKLQLIKRIFVQ